MAKWIYTAEIGGASEGTKEVSDVVLAESEERAREFAKHALEEEYPGEDGWILLSLEVESL